MRCPLTSMMRSPGQPIRRSNLGVGFLHLWGMQPWRSPSKNNTKMILEVSSTVILRGKTLQLFFMGFGISKRPFEGIFWFKNPVIYITTPGMRTKNFLARTRKKVFKKCIHLGGLTSWKPENFLKRAGTFGRLSSQTKSYTHENDLVGGFNPSEKYISQIGSFPEVGVKIKIFETTTP